MGVEGSAEGLRARVGGERVASLAELAWVLPVQIIDPEIHRLIEEGPNRRRRFLDWGVFHVEQPFVAALAAISAGAAPAKCGTEGAAGPRAWSMAWDAELVRYGELITEARRRYVAQLAPVAAGLARQLLGLELVLAYRRGLVSGRPICARPWTRASARTRSSGSTQVGPHRADLAIRLEGMRVRDRVSRGQQKLLAAVLLLRRSSCFPRTRAARPTLLLDDPAAELDGEHLRMLLDEVRAQPVQLIVTTLQAGSAELAGFGTPAKALSRLTVGVVRPV